MQKPRSVEKFLFLAVCEILILVYSFLSLFLGAGYFMIFTSKSKVQWSGYSVAIPSVAAITLLLIATFGAMKSGRRGVLWPSYLLILFYILELVFLAILVNKPLNF